MLFLGNSYTARNDVPGLVRALGAADTPPIAIEVASRTPGGCSLRAHFNNAEAQALIAQGFDVVVLQEQSRNPVVAPKRTLSSVHDLAKVIEASGAALVLYMTWARASSPEDQEAIAATYTTAAEGVEGTKPKVAAVGLAWQRALRERPKVQLHDDDDSHPTALGSALAALVLYRTIAGRSVPAARSFARALALSDDDAAFLERCAGSPR